MVLTRIACSNLMQKVITRWRQEHEDWEALAAFVLSKNTGRRFKNKPHGDLNSMLDVSIARKTGDVSENNLSKRTAAHFPDRLPDDDTVSGCISVNTENRQTMSIKSGADKPLKSKHEQNASHKLQATEHLQMQQLSDKSRHSVTEHVVKRVSLDELSDEELFLPPPDDDVSESVDAAVQNASAKIANSFFVVNDEESSDDETPVSKTMASSSDSDDDSTIATGLRNSIKSSTKFASSLSHCQHSYAVRTAGEDKRRKRTDSFQQNQRFRDNAKKYFDNRNAARKPFSDKQFRKSRGSHSLKKNEKSSYGKSRTYTKYALVMFIVSY